MVFTETIMLEDKVTPAARAAQASLVDLDRGLALVNKTLTGTEGLAEKATRPLVKAPSALPGTSTPAGAPAPSSLPASLPTPTSSGGEGFAKLALSGETAQTVVKQLTDSLKAAEVELAKSAALGDQVGYDKALTSMAQYSTALANIGPIQEAASKPIPPLVLNADNWKQAQDIAKGLTDQLKAAEQEMMKAQLTGDGDAFVKASQSADQLKQSLTKLPAPAKEVKQETSSMWADAAHAAEVGATTIGTAIGGIKNAFSALASGDVKGAIAGATESIAGMAKMLDLVVPGLGQLVSMVVTIVGGVVGITAGLVSEGMKFAVASSQAKQQMLSMFDAMGDGVGAGLELDEMLSGLADRTGITKDELSGITQRFLQFGVTGKDALEKLTLAAISAKAIVGSDAGAAAFENLTKKIELAAQTGQGLKIPLKGLGSLAEMGLKVDDVAKKMNLSAGELANQLKAGSVDARKFGDAMTEALIEKGAGPLEKLGNSVENIKKKFLQDIGDMFEDIDVAPFMKEVKALFGIFAASTPSGEAMKAGIGGFFKEAFAVATKLVPLVKHFLLDMVIYGLKAYIALKPIVEKVKEFFASATGSAVLSVVLDALWAALKGIGIAIAVVVGFFAMMAAVSITVGVALWAIIGTLATFAISLSTSIVEAIAGAITALIDWVAGAPQMAMDFVTGLVNGITAGAGAVAGAVTNLASGAADAFTSFMGIKSPSTLMHQFGLNTGEGVVGGLDEVGPEVHSAASNMAGMVAGGAAAAPTISPLAGGDTAAAGGGGGAGGSGGGGTSIVLEPGAIQISGQGKDWAEVTEEMIAAVMERLAMQVGAA